MCILTLVTILLVPLGVAAVPAPNRTAALRAIPHIHQPSRIRSVNSSVVTPLPCAPINPLPDEDETHTRFDEFAEAFLVEKNLTHAFEYISSVYINHSPLSKEDGPDAALDVLATFWDTIQITPLRTKFEGNMSWLDYEASGNGEIIDRFRWEAGCIVEHWDQGETFPDT
ncbi:hypothetical protein F4804DRAFT_316810 [Jackrogersella minutella]|nr:hypothetical protein F4804DRAFT_316810 [Jackrogersella minutella]